MSAHKTNKNDKFVVQILFFAYTVAGVLCTNLSIPSVTSNKIQNKRYCEYFVYL